MAISSPGEPDLSRWVMVDTLTVEQAACLWAGIDPSKNPYTRTAAEASRFAPILQAMSASVQSGRLPADASANALSTIGRHESSLVTRDDLLIFASAKGERPAFLFDTLIPDAAANELPAVVDPQTTKPKGGRPQEYDWDALTIEIVASPIPRTAFQSLRPHL